jgi:16S rRNA (adenine1518-N6/adenine1519-N6)-dimethyltransferase
LKHRARRRFGQNFLVDQAVIARIIQAIAPEPGQQIIEIGPGQGALTRLLVESGAAVHAVEIDRDLAEWLTQAIQTDGQLVIHRCDALEADLGSIAGQRPYRLVGNLPYNISTPLLFHILGQPLLPLDMHVMLQTEVVERIVAEPGGRDYGRLSVMVQNLCEAAPLFDIGPDSFEPQPRVNSTLLRLLPRPAPVARAPAESFDSIVRAAFGKRRKTLRNSLGGLLDEAGIRATGVDPTDRPEQLSVAQFDALAQQLPQR